MSEIVDTTTPEEPKSGLTATADIKHNNTLTADIKHNATFSASAVNMANVASSQNLSDNQSYGSYLKGATGAVSAKARESADRYLSAINYDVSGWVDTFAADVDPRSKYMKEWYAAQKTKEGENGLTNAAASVIAESIINGDQTKHAALYEELKALDADAEKYGLDPDFFKQVKQQKLAEWYYTKLKDERLPKGLLSDLKFGTMSRYLSQKDFNIVTDAAIKQNAYLNDLNNRLAVSFHHPVYEDEFTYDPAKERVRVVKRPMYTRGGQIAELLDRRNDLILSGEVTPEMHRELLDQELMIGRIREETNFLGQLTDGVTEWASSWLAGATDRAGNNFNSLGSTGNEELDSVISDVTAIKRYELMNDNVSALLKENIYNPKYQNATIQQLSESLLTNSYGKAYVIGGMGQEALNFVSGGKGGAAVKAQRAINRATSRIATKHLSKEVPHVLESLAVDASINKKALALTDIVGKDAVKQLKFDLGMFGAEMAMQQTLEGLSKAALNETLSQYSSTNKSNLRAFAEGASENFLTNLAINTVGSAIPVGLDMHRISKNGHQIEALEQYNKAVQDLSNMKDAGPAVKEQAAKVVIDTGGISPKSYFNLARMQDKVNTLRTAGQEDEAKRLEGLIEKYKGYSDMPEYPDGATLEVPTEKLMVDMSDAQNREVLHDLVALTSDGRTRDDIVKSTVRELEAQFTKNPVVSNTMFDDPSKNARLRSAAIQNATTDLSGRLYDQMQGLGLKNVDKGQLSNFAHNLGRTLVRLSDELGFSVDDFLKKYDIKFQVVEDKFDLTGNPAPKVMGEVKPNSMTILLSNDAGFSTIAHESAHLMTEILMLEEKTFRERGVKQAVEAIDAIREKFKGHLDGKTWADLTPNEKHEIQEWLISNYFLNLLYKVRDNSDIADTGVHKVNALFNLAVAEDMRRTLGVDINKVDEAKDIARGSTEYRQISAGATAAKYAEDVKANYGLDPTETTGDFADRMANYREWLDASIAEEDASRRMRNQLGLDEQLDDLSDLKDISGAEDFNEDTRRIVARSIDVLFNSIDTIKSEFKANVAAFSNLLIKDLGNLFDSLGNYTHKFGGDGVNAPRVSPERYDLELRKKRLNETSGIGETSNAITNTKAQRKVTREAIKVAKNEADSARTMYKDAAAKVKQATADAEAAVNKQIAIEAQEVKAEIDRRISASDDYIQNLEVSYKEAKEAGQKDRAKEIRKSIKENKAIRNKLAALKSNRRLYEFRHGEGAVAKAIADAKAKVDVASFTLAKDAMQKTQATLDQLTTHNERLTAQLKNLEAQLNDLKVRYASELEALSKEDAALKNKELTNARRVKVLQDANAKYHTVKDAEFKKLKAEFDNPDSQLRVDYERLKALEDGFRDSFVLSEDSLRAAAQLNNMSPTEIEILVRELRARKMLTTEEGTSIKRGKKELTVYDFNTLAANVSGGDAMHLLKTLNEMTNFDRDPDKFVLNCMDSSSYLGIKSDIDAAMYIAEERLCNDMLAATKEVRTGVQELAFARDPKLGRGPAITNVAKLQQHRVGKLTYNNASVNILLRKAKVFYREGCKMAGNPNTWRRAVKNLAIAERLITMASAASKTRKIVDNRIVEIRKFMSGDKTNRFKNYDREVMLAYEYLAERAGFVKNRTGWSLLTPDERASTLHSVKEKLGAALAQTHITKETYDEIMNALTNNSLSDNFNNMQLGHLVALTDGMRVMKKTARDLRKIQDEIDKDAIKKAGDNLNSLLEEKINESPRLAKKLDSPKDLTDNKSNQGFFGRLFKAVSSAKNQLIKVESLCEILDKSTNGFFKQYIFNPIREAHVNYIDKRSELADRLTKIYQEVSELDAKGPKSYSFGDFKVKYVIDGIEKEIPLAKILFGVTGKDRGHPTRAVFQFVINMGAPDNRAHLTRHLARNIGVDVDAADTFCQQMLEKMVDDGIVTKELMDKAQDVWDLFRDVHDLTAPVYQRLTNLKYKEVKGQDLKFKFGTYRGGYVPLSIDSRYTAPLDSNDLHGTLLDSNKPNNDFTKERSSGAGVVYDISIPALFRRLDDQVRYAYMAEPVIKADTILKSNPDITRRLEAYQDSDQIFKEFLLEAGTGGKQRQSPNEIKFFNFLLNAPGTMVMAFNFVNAFMNLGNFVLAAGTRVSVGEIASGVGSWIKRGRGFQKDIAAKSKFMKQRMVGSKMSFERSIRKANGDGRFLDAVASLNENSYIFQTVFQNRIDAIIWQGSYDSAIARLRKEHPRMDAPALEAAAVREADMKVRTTQGSIDAIDTSRADKFRTVGKLIAPFSNFFIHQRNLIRAEWAIAGAEARAFDKYMHRARVIAIGFIASNMAGEYLRALANGDATNNSEKDAATLATGAVIATGKGAISTFVHPVVGAVASYGIDYTRGEYVGSGPFATPALTWTESLVKTIDAATKAIVDDEDWEERDMRNFAKVMGMFVPVAYNATGYVQTAINIGTDEYNDTDAFDTTRALLTGKPSANMKN